MEDKITLSAFKVIGGDEVALQAVQDDGPMLVIINGKLFKATNVVQPVLKLVPSQEGPVQPGELVVLEANLTNEFPQFVKNSKIQWTATENGKSKQYWNDGRKIVFGTGVKATLINVDVEITLDYMIDTEVVSKSIKASAVVTVGNPPTPDPTPNPDPEPTPPSNEVARMVFNWAMDPSIVKREGDGSLVRIGAIALSDNFNKIAQTIGSNDFKTISDILVATKSGNNESLINAGINPIVWDVWGKQLQDFLYKKYTAKELTTLDQFKVMWMNISSGLAAVQ